MAASWALIVHDHKILLTQRSSRTSRPDQWCLPGGGIKKDESAATACLREALEETGLSIRVCNLIEPIEDTHYFLCELVSAPQEVKLQITECQDAVWVEPSQILSVGMIMDSKRLILVLDTAGLETPVISDEKCNGDTL